MIRRGLLLFGLTLLAGCSEPDETPDAGASQATVPGAPAHDMAGMDHVSAGPVPVAGDSVGHDMTAMAHPPAGAGAPAAAPMVGMDHGAAPTSASSAQMPAMDHMAHSAEPPPSSPVAARPSTPPPAPGADHAAHAVRQGSAPSLPRQAPESATRPADAGAEATPVADEKLRALVAELVRDPAVLRIIETDSVLSRLWASEGVRRALLARP